MMCATIGGIFLYKSYAYYEEDKEYNVIKGIVPDFGHDIKLSFTIDGKESTTAFPNKDSNYVGSSVTCSNNVTAEWDNVNWGLKNIVANNNKKVNYNVAFKTVINQTLTNYVTSLYSSDKTNLTKDEANNIRYIGGNPNNYVLLDNQLWRIVGVFNNQIKLVLNNTLGNVVYDVSSDEWASSKLQAFLRSAVTAKISEDTQKLIDMNHTWQLGRLNISNFTPKNLYDAERTSSWTGTTALLYLSDYGYAVDATNRSTCLKTTMKSWPTNCHTNNWLFKGWMWYLNYYYSSTTPVVNVPQVDGNGVLHNGAVYVYNTSAVYPSLFLKSDVLYITGSGTASDPMLIKSSN